MLHAMDLGARRAVVELRVERQAMVLGSTQADTDVDPDALARRGVQMARRRSGGGAVLLVPGEHTWLDVVVPARDPLWCDDVEAATWWLGEAWAEALAGVGIDGSVHDRGVTDRHAGRVACFAALGPGEVSIDGSKLVGISQRRTREMARFQCVLHRCFNASDTTSLLTEPARGSVGTRLHDGVVDLERLGVDREWSVVEGLLAVLP